MKKSTNFYKEIINIRNHFVLFSENAGTSHMKND